MVNLSAYSSFDYLSNEPFYLEGIGRIKCPTLLDIRKVTYRMFLLYQRMISLNVDEYLQIKNIPIPTNQSGTTTSSIFMLFLAYEPSVLYGFLDFFTYDIVKFNKDTVSFDIYDIDNPEIVIGNINNDNFDMIRNELELIMFQGKSEQKKAKYKNKLAQEMHERILKHNKSRKVSSNEDYELDNLIRKYCTNNKVGINIINVWDLTFYQFTAMFNEYQQARQADCADMMAANTFNYKKSSDYKPMDYMKKLK